jgi:cytidylate kinase
VLKGEKTTLEEVLSDMRKRDHADSSREASPLKQADDAVVVDTTKHTIDSQTDFILDLALVKMAPAGDDA